MHIEPFCITEGRQNEMDSYKMQYPKFLFKKEQKDYSNDMFRIEQTQFLINTANPFNIAAVARKIRKLNPDLVMIQWWHPYFAPCYWILESLLGKKYKKMFICHNVFPHERFPLDKLLTKAVLKKADYFIVHAKSDGDDLLSIKPNAQFRQNPHPTYHAFQVRNLSKEQARQELHKTQEEKLLLFFGFVREYKGLKHLLQAMPIIRQQLENVKLMVVGAFGSDKEDNWRFYLVVLPYESATQSGIVQIAYGFEKPVIVTNVGGLPDVVIEGKTGYIVPSQQPKALAEAIVRYFQLQKEQEFTENVRKEAYRFSWDRMTEKVGELLEMGEGNA